MNEKGLNIIKARVEQDKYEAAELRIIKADGERIEKDLYIEKDFNNGEFFSCSDNVLVSLHRALRSGEVANLKLISYNGEILTEPVFSSIEAIDYNLFLCVKSVSDMISVQNNKSLREDALKVQEIAQDAESIKEQVRATMKASNPSGEADFKFVYEDAYNEVVIYRIEKTEEGYKAVVVGDRASFVAMDGVNLYTHSNIVTDTTKIELIGDPSANDAKIAISTSEEKTEEVEEKAAELDTNTDNQVENNDEEIDEEDIEDEDLDDEDSVKTEDEEQEENDDLDDSEISAEEHKKEVEEKVEKKETKKPVKKEGKKTPFANVEFVSDEEYNRLSEMVSKLIKEEKDSKEDGKEKAKKIEELEDDIKKLEDIVKDNQSKINSLTKELEKEVQTVEEKTKKINTLINENRKYIDENIELNNKVKEYEEKTKNLEEENTRLKEETLKGKDKIEAVLKVLEGNK